MSSSGPRNRRSRDLEVPAGGATSFAEVAEKSGVAPLPVAGSGRVPPAPRSPKAPAPTPKPALVIRDDEGWLDGARPGLPRPTLRKLAGVPGATLDLHGLDAYAAERAVRRFVRERRTSRARLVLVVVGRGRRSPGGVGVIRQAIGGWLGTLGEHILAFRTAPADLGGDGAVLVLLAGITARS